MIWTAFVQDFAVGLPPLIDLLGWLGQDLVADFSLMCCDFEGHGDSYDEFSRLFEPCSYFHLSHYYPNNSIDLPLDIYGDSMKISYCLRYQGPTDNSKLMKQDCAPQNADSISKFSRFVRCEHSHHRMTRHTFCFQILKRWGLEISYHVSRDALEVYAGFSVEYQKV